jgi:hypothetical protein
MKEWLVEPLAARIRVEGLDDQVPFGAEDDRVIDRGEL